jgi:hypothetical protein
MMNAGLPLVLEILEILEKNFCPGMSWDFKHVLEFLRMSWKYVK